MQRSRVRLPSAPLRRKPLKIQGFSRFWGSTENGPKTGRGRIGEEWQRPIQPGHSAGGASWLSYHVHGFDAQAVADYMGSGVAVSGGAISGCEVYLNTKHNSINAVSKLPLGQIQGSGITPTGQYAAHHATLCDLEGKSGDGPHYFFESDADVARKIADGTYALLPLCSGCGLVRWRAGQLCPRCAKP